MDKLNEGLVVLSLFDGMSCGRLALNKANIKVKTYIASEIKKNAIKLTQHHFPDTIQIGDVTKVSYKNGILYYENGQIETKIDMVIGGSPCQDFSAAKWSNFNYVEDGKYGLQGDKSSLFYQYLRILKEVNPKYYLLENVKMKKESKIELDNFMGVEGIPINSNLVSYQNRPRIYWTNIPDVTAPEDRNVNFQDYKETDPSICKQYKLNVNKTSLGMWNNGEGRKAKFKGDNTSKYCENVTHSNKIACVTTKQYRSPNAGVVQCEDFARLLTRKELELAQTLPEGYTDILSYNQMQDVVGDGWTVDVIAHIFSFIKK